MKAKLLSGYEFSGEQKRLSGTIELCDIAEYNFSCKFHYKGDGDIEVADDYDSCPIILGDYDGHLLVEFTDIKAMMVLIKLKGKPDLSEIFEAFKYEWNQFNISTSEKIRIGLTSKYNENPLLLNIVNNKEINSNGYYKMSKTLEEFLSEEDIYCDAPSVIYSRIYKDSNSVEHSFKLNVSLTPIRSGYSRNKFYGGKITSYKYKLYGSSISANHSYDIVFNMNKKCDELFKSFTEKIEYTNQYKNDTEVKNETLSNLLGCLVKSYRKNYEKIVKVGEGEKKSGILFQECSEGYFEIKEIKSYLTLDTLKKVIEIIGQEGKGQCSI